MRKLENTSKLVLIAVIFFILGVVIGYFINNPWLEIINNNKEQNIQKDNVTSILLNQFSDKYTAKTYLSGNSIITVASSNTTCCGEGSSDPYDKRASPLIIIDNKTTNEITAIYEITFDAQNRDFSIGNIISHFDSSLIDVDGDKDLEFTSSWKIDWGGSSGLIGMVILKKDGDNYIPLTGYPFPHQLNDDISDFVITNKIINKQTILPVIGTDSFSKFQDLNRDGRDEFLYAQPVWNYEIGDNFESHFDDHKWLLEVYEWNGKKFQNPKWWNDGKSFTTTEKIPYFDNEVRLFTDFQNKTKQ